MLDIKTLNQFRAKVDCAYQQFCVWMYANNEFARHQKEWDPIAIPQKLYKTEEFSQIKGCRYKNYWDVVISSLQQSWILSLARLFDPAYHFSDKKKDSPRLSVQYLLELLDDEPLAQIIRGSFRQCDPTIKSIKMLRDNFLAHNDIHFPKTNINAGVENLFKILDDAISNIKRNKPHLLECSNVNLQYIDDLSRSGVNEIFEALVFTGKTAISDS